MSNFKKIALIIGFFSFIVIFGVLLYVIFFRPLLPETLNVNTPISGRNLPLAGINENRNIAPLSLVNGRLPLTRNINEQEEERRAVEDFIVPKAEARPLSETRVFGASASVKGSEIYYYDKTSGKFLAVGSDGSERFLSDKIFFQVENIVWSHNREKVILEYPDGANIVYGFSDKKQITLPTHWTDFDFSSDNQNIVSKSFGVNPENNFLILSDASATKSKILRELGANGDQVIASWSPNNQMVGMFLGEGDFDRQEVFFIGLNNENFKSMTVEGRGFQGKWSPQGDRLLYSVYSSLSDNKPELWIVDAAPGSIGRNRKRLQLETWSEKCVFFDNNTVYCAVPDTLEANSGLFPEEMDRWGDAIYKINLNTGSKSLISELSKNHVMKDPIVLSDGKYFYFTDKNDGKLYKVLLK